VRTIVALIAVVALAAYGAYLVSANQDPVPVDLLFAAPDLTLWESLLGAFLVGVAGVMIGFAWPVIRMRLVVRTQARRIRQLEQELHGLRTLPLTEEEPAASATAREG
jgi:uncharacterized membrane protein YciS (DUF1049 family)